VVTEVELLVESVQLLADSGFTKLNRLLLARLLPPFDSVKKDKYFNLCFPCQQSRKMKFDEKSLKRIPVVSSSVADPESGAFLPPGSRIPYPEDMLFGKIFVRILALLFFY
jgi:hypothetical protein